VSKGDKAMNKGKEEKTSLEEEPGGYVCALETQNSEEKNIQDKWPAADDFICDVEGLARYLPLDQKEIFLLKNVESRYHLKIPFYYFSLIKDLQDKDDPIRRQCVLSLQELNKNYSEKEDPLSEIESSVCSCLVHRYPDRALLLVTNSCFMYCRHCTRKRIWHKNVKEPSKENIEKALDYLRKNSNIREVIVSGGDPLTLSNTRLDEILSAVSSCSNIEVVRIGTRAPVVFPQRINEGLCEVLEKYGNIWINVQFNHPREVTEQAVSACRKLQKLGIPVSNQSVLLKGINDSREVMLDLCQKLQSMRIRPYYLFQCDPVVGTAHFKSSIRKGRRIIEQMQGFTSGMCIPNFVIDGPGGKGKVPFGPSYVVSESEEGVTLKNYKKEMFFCPDGAVRPVSAPENRLEVNTLGIAFNLKKEGGLDDTEEYDEIETIESLAKQISKYGPKVILLEQNSSFLKEVQDKKPDFVFNIAEGRGSSRARESQVPAVLESLNIPYFGSDPIALGIALDKYLANKILRPANIPVPFMASAASSSEVESLKGIFGKKKIFIIKPRWEGSSKGIFLDSLVDSFEGFKEKALHMLCRYSQPVVVEEFLEKDEITVGICGNEKPSLLGMMKIGFKEEGPSPFLYSLETKKDWEDKVKYEPEENIPIDIRELVKKYSLKAYRTLELRDVARIDFRVGSDNIPRIIDVNPLPGLSQRYSDLPILYRLKGGSYSDLIKILLEESLARCGLKWPKSFAQTA